MKERDLDITPLTPEGGGASHYGSHTGPIPFLAGPLPPAVNDASSLPPAEPAPSSAAPSASAVSDAYAMLRGVLDAGFDAFAIARAQRAPTGEIADLLVVEVNARACDMVGRPRESLINQSLLSVFPHSRTWRLWEQVCAVILTQRPLETTQHAPLPEEPDRWLQRQIVPLPDDHVAISSRDVTQRHRAQRALAASEARFRGLFENNGAAQLLVDCDTSRILDANAAAEAFYGWSRATLSSMTLADLDVHGASEWRHIVESIRAGRGARAQREHRVASGERRHVDFSAGCVDNASRTVMHCLVLDMTERVRSEQQLRESERRFRALIAGMREGVVLHDESGVIRIHNPAAERILGLTGAQLTGLHPIERDWQATHEDGSPWPTALHPAQIALRTGRSQPRQLMQVARGASQPTWIVVTADPLIRPGESRPYAALAVFSDVTELRHSDERLREAMTFEAVADVAGSIGHDLNNVLTVIRAATTFLRDGMSGTSPQLDDVAAIERATDRAEWLTRRLLAAGRRPAPPHAGVDLLPLVRAACEAASREVLAPFDAAVSLQLDPSSTAQMVAVDPVRVRDVVDTMLRMASAGGESASVTGPLLLRTGPAEGDEGMAELALRCTSNVIDADLAARLAAPGFEPERSGGDRELALAVLHTLLRQTGGRLRVDVPPPGSTAGSIVRAQWPVVSESAATQAVPVAEQTEPAVVSVAADTVTAAAVAAVGADAVISDSDTPPETAPSPRRQGGVLLVDDDARLRDLGRRMFERAGDAVYTAATGREALTFLAARSDEVALVVTDLTMPDIGGLELIEIMATRYPDIPVMAISGYGVAPGTQERLAARHVPYVQKPFTMDVLLETASRVRAAWPAG